MKWFEVELEIPIYGKCIEIVKAPDPKLARTIALRKTELEYNMNSKNFIILKIKEVSS